MDSQPIALSTELGELIELTRRLEETASTLVTADEFAAARWRVAQRLRDAQDVPADATGARVA